MTTNVMRRSALRFVFHPLGFLVTAALLFVVSIAFRLTASTARADMIAERRGPNVLPPRHELVRTLETYEFLCVSFLCLSCVFFLASAYLWVHRER